MKFGINRPWLFRNRLPLQKLWYSLHYPPPPGGTSLPPLGDILNYLSDVHEIWGILSLTIMKSIAITRIMVDLKIFPPGGQGVPPLGYILNYLTDFHEIWWILSLTIMKSIAIARIMVDPQFSPRGAKLYSFPPLWGIFLTFRTVFMKFGIYCPWLSWN